MPYCSQNNEAMFICDQAKCRRENPFVCNKGACECNEVSHKDCSLISWKKFNQDLNSPERYRSQFQDIIENIEGMISYSQKMNEILKEEIIKCKTFLSKNQENRVQILKLVEESDFKRIYKSHILEYLEFFRVANQQSKLKDLIVKNVKIIKENQLEIQKYFKLIYEGDTDLINSVEDVGKFFSEKIKYLKLLYRASDRGFLTDKFHQLCDNVPNTIVIVKTQFDKVFGGFSPSCWGGTGAMEDTSEQSFIFSLTNDEKMEIINTKYAIFNCVKVGPIFGGGNSMMADIQICDRANEVRKSGSNFPVNYNNSKKYQTGQGGIEHLTGQKKGRYFYIKQWQVFEVAFESDTQVSVEQFLA